MNKARFILSKSKVIEQYNIVKELADEVSYSLKTNPEVGKVLEQNTDCSFSIHNTKSLELIKNNKIWFFAQGLTLDVLDALFSRHVDSFVVDNQADLGILLDYLGKNNQKINLLLRMRLKEHTIQTGKHYVFGMFSKEINELVPKLKNNNNINKLGIHFHRKTQNIAEWSLKDEFCEAISPETLRQIDMVNIGGGLPCEYKNYNHDLTGNIFKNIKEFKDYLGKNNIKMIIEPGRFIAAPSIKLETEIMLINNNNIIVNCSIFNSAMDTFIADIRLLVKGELEKGHAYTIKGCTPDSRDIFRYKAYLEKPKIGDKITFLNAGAYNFASDFCNLEKLETILVD